MKSNYKKLGQFIAQIDKRNSDNAINYLRGVSSVFKSFIKSKANMVGVDLKKYKVVNFNQFAFNPNTARMEDKIPIALNLGETCVVSSIYPVFEISDLEQLDPEYLMMWFRRPEFDRYARFYSHGSAREVFGWDDMCEIELPVPTIEKQREIVRKYNLVDDRIALNEKLTLKLEDTAQAIYKQWFVDFEFLITKEYAQSIGKPELEGQLYKSSGGEMEYCEKLEADIPMGWQQYNLEDLVERVCVGFVGVLHSSYCREKMGVRLLRTTDLTDQGMRYAANKFVLPEFHNKNKKSQLKHGDILVARHGSNGMPVIYDREDEANCLNVIIVKPSQNRMSSKLVHLFMKSDPAVDQVRGSLHGSVQSVLNTKIVASMKLPYFNKESINHVDSAVFSKIQKIIEEVRKEVDSLSRLRTLLLTRITKA